MSLAKIVGILALLSRASAFVQPDWHAATQSARTATLPKVSASVGIDLVGQSVGSDADHGSAARSVFVGLAFGFALGFAGLLMPTSASADEIKVPDRCVRTEGCIGEIADAWAKKKFAEINTTCADFDPSKGKGYLCFDKKFQKATTGAGRYKEFKMDFASPWPMQEKGYRAADKSAWKNTKEEDLKNFKAYLEEKKGSNTAQAPYKWNKNVWDLRK